MLTFPRSAASKAREIEAAKAGAIARVNAAIGAARATHLTAIPGQEMIYAAKEAEARAWLATGAVGPFMTAEVGITAATPAELAHLWITMADAWMRIGPQLEQLRLGTIAELKAAASGDEIAALLAELDGIMEGM